MLACYCNKLLQKYATYHFCIVLKVVCKCELLLRHKLLSFVFCKLAGDLLIIKLWFLIVWTNFTFVFRSNELTFGSGESHICGPFI